MSLMYGSFFNFFIYYFFFYEYIRGGFQIIDLFTFFIH